MTGLRHKFYLILTLSLISFFSLSAAPDSTPLSFTIGVMQDKKDVAKKYTPLVNYFALNGITVRLKGFRSYKDAAKQFKDGKLDAMFAGSGVAAIMILKNLALPLVRPQHNGDWNTYWAVVIVPKDNSDFEMSEDYLKDKRIICCALASSGEFFCRSIVDKDKKLLIAGNHGNAIAALSKGAADVAVVKNRVWESEKTEYPDLKKVAEDHGENPDSTLIVSTQLKQEDQDKIRAVLLKLKDDTTSEASALKRELQITGFIKTDKKDFTHTFLILKKAGIDKDFDF